MEKTLLQIILAGGLSAEYLLSKLKPDDFFDPRARIVFNLLQLAFKKHKTILGKDALLLILSQIQLEQVKDCIAFLQPLVPVNITLQELDVLLVDVIKKRIKEIVNTEQQVDIMLLKINNLCSSFTNNVKSYTVDEINESTKTQIQTPWEILNKTIPHSFNKQDLCVLLAGVNVGKTMFLCNLLKSPYLANKVVRYVSCEDGSIRIKNRLTKILGDPIMFFRKNNIDFRIVEAYSPSLPVIRQIATNTDLLIIDYLDRISTQITEFRFMLRYIAEGLKEIAEECNTLIWTAKQIRREGLNKQLVSMIDIGESFAVCESPDLILGMSIDDKKCYLNIAKSRDVRYGDLVVLECNTENQEIYE